MADCPRTRFGRQWFYPDLNGDNDYSDSAEWQDTRTHNEVNELTKRELDTNNTAGFELTYNLTHDAVGNMSDDGKDYTYKHDALGRLVEVKTRGGSPTLVAEYRYNGLGYRTGWHYDVTQSGGGAPDGTVDSNDPWYYFCHDERWRIVATFRGSDANRKEVFV